MKILIIQPKGFSHISFTVTEQHLSKIKEVGPGVVVVVASDPQDVAYHVPSSEVMVGVFRFLPSIKEAKQLKWVHGLGAGADALSPEIINAPVLVSNSSGVAAVPIAEHILGFILLFTKQFYTTFRNQHQKKWEKQKLTELRGKTVLIVGLGHVGKEASRILSCLGARVLAVDKKNSEELNEMLPLADFVVICLPLTKETHHLFSREKFNRMKPTAVLMNIGRGAIVNEKELIEALLQKTIAGAALDVQETEPLPPDSPLWAMENVVITPHHSPSSEKYMDRAIDLFCLNLQAYLKGERLPNLIDKTAGY